MLTQTSLFPLPESLEFENVHQRLLPIIPIAWRCLSESFTSVAERIESREEDFLAMAPGELAQFLHPQIRRRLEAAFPYGNPYGVRIVHRHRILILSYRNEIELRVKKLRKDFSISNFHTPHDEEYWAENERRGGMRRLVFGYKAFSRFTQMRAFVTMPMPGQKPQWFEVEDQTAALVAIREEELKRITEADDTLRMRRKPRVKPKKDSSKKAGGPDVRG